MPLHVTTVNSIGADSLGNVDTPGGLVPYQNSAMSASVLAYVWKDNSDNITRIYEPLRNNEVFLKTYTDKFPFDNTDCFDNVINDVDLLNLSSDVILQNNTLESMVINGNSFVTHSIIDCHLKGKNAGNTPNNAEIYLVGDNIALTSLSNTTGGNGFYLDRVGGNTSMSNCFFEGGNDLDFYTNGNASIGNTQFGSNSGFEIYSNDGFSLYSVEFGPNSYLDIIGNFSNVVLSPSAYIGYNYNAGTIVTFNPTNQLIYAGDITGLLHSTTYVYISSGGKNYSNKVFSFSYDGGGDQTTVNFSYDLPVGLLITDFVAFLSGVFSSVSQVYVGISNQVLATDINITLINVSINSANQTIIFANSESNISYGEFATKSGAPTLAEIPVDNLITTFRNSDDDTFGIWVNDAGTVKNIIGNPIELQVNSVDNASQTKLNLVDSDTVTFEDLGAGSVTAHSTGGGGTFTDYTIDYAFTVTFDGGAGTGATGAVTIPTFLVKTGWFIETVFVNVATPLVQDGSGGYFILGYTGLDNIGLNSLTGLFDTLNTSVNTKIELATLTESTSDSNQLVMNVVGDNVTTGVINVLVRVTNYTVAISGDNVGGSVALPLNEIGFGTGPSITSSPDFTWQTTNNYLDVHSKSGGPRFIQFWSPFYLSSDSNPTFAMHPRGALTLTNYGPSNPTLTLANPTNIGHENLLIDGGAGGLNSGYGIMQQMITGSAAETGLNLKNTGTGGGWYNIFSSNNSSGVGGGNFIIGDVNNSVTRLKIDANGFFFLPALENGAGDKELRFNTSTGEVTYSDFFTPTLQQVTDVGNTVTNGINITAITEGDIYVSTADLTTQKTDLIFYGLLYTRPGGNTTLTVRDDITSGSIYYLPDVPGGIIQTLPLSVNGNVADTTGNISLGISNGLSIDEVVNVGDIILGGSLNQNTTIDANSQTLSINGTSGGSFSSQFTDGTFTSNISAQSSAAGMGAVDTGGSQGAIQVQSSSVTLHQTEGNVNITAARPDGSSVSNALTFNRGFLGTAADGIGEKISFFIQYGTIGLISEANSFTSKLTDVTSNGTSEFSITGLLAGSTQTLLQISGAGIFTLTQGLQNFANDGAAATGGIPVGALYRNGSIVMIRVT